MSHSTPAAAAIPIRQAGPDDRPAGGLSTLSQTPGGNFYGSTPGGTKIVYSRSQLLALSSSPMSKSPPKGLANFPEISKSSAAASAQGQMGSKKNGVDLLTPFGDVIEKGNAAAKKGAAATKNGIAAPGPVSPNGAPRGDDRRLTADADEQFEMDL